MSEAAVLARRLVRRARSAALATALAGSGGHAYASFVTVAADVDCSPLLLLSDLADHTRNLKADNRASLLIEAASRRANPQTGPRVTLIGRIARTEAERHRHRFLIRHPAAAKYAVFSDFVAYRMDVERVHFVGGFANARWFNGPDFVLPKIAADAIAAAAPDVLAQLNADRQDTLDLVVAGQLGRRGHGWRLVAIDPEGCDFNRNNVFARLDFPAPVETPDGLRTELAKLADAAGA